MKESKWFAVYTFPKMERRVTEILEKKEIKTYCPVSRQSSDRGKGILEPLFSSYVFICVTEDEHEIITQTRGVMNFIYWHGKPAVIRDEEIEAIKKFINEYPQVRLEKMPVNYEDNMRVIDGKVMLRKGNVLEVRNNIVRVTLPSLGQVLVADARKEINETLSVYSGNISVRV